MLGVSETQTVFFSGSNLSLAASNPPRMVSPTLNTPKSSL